MKTTKWTIQDYLKTPHLVAGYLQIALMDTRKGGIDNNLLIRIAVKDAIKALRKMK